MKNLLSFIYEASVVKEKRVKSDEREVINDHQLKKEFGKIELIDPDKDLSKEEKNI